MPKVQVPSDQDVDDHYETSARGRRAEREGGGRGEGGGDDVVSLRAGGHADINVGLVFDGFHADLTDDVKFQFYEPPSFDTSTRLVTVDRPRSLTDISVTVRVRRFLPRVKIHLHVMKNLHFKHTCSLNLFIWKRFVF